MNDANEPVSDLSRRAVDAAVAVASGLGVRGSSPVVLADGANVLVRLGHTPVVARVATTTALVRDRPEQWFAREVAVASYLARQGAPVVPPSDEVPPGPHLHHGYVMTFWRHVEHDAGRIAPPDVVATMLRELHQVLRDYPEELPYLHTPLADITTFLRNPSLLATMEPADAALLRKAFDTVAPAIRALAGAGQALHGDPHPRNLLAVGTAWLWSDFEDTCAGPVEWDLACLAATTRVDGPAALAHYGDGVDPQRLEPCFELRRLHALVWWLIYGSRFARDRPEAARRLHAWRDRR